MDGEQRKQPGEQSQHFVHEAAQEPRDGTHPDKQQYSDIEAGHVRA
jgi:hypothetical protein